MGGATGLILGVFDQEHTKEDFTDQSGWVTSPPQVSEPVATDPRLRREGIARLG